MEASKSPIQRLVALLCGGCVTAIILLIMNRDYPFVGHDYGYFIPHIIDTGIHIRLNGLTIQWYTPSFGGGLPGFPNPQHMEYSIVQLLALWLHPWLAVLVSTAGISLVGYYFFYRCLSEHLGLNWISSTLGAMFFVGNGFYIGHLVSGQMGYQLFPLGAIILYILTDRQPCSLYNGTVIALVITLMIFQAGFYLIIIFILSLSITLPILYLYKAEILNLRSIALTTFIAIGLSIAMAASKLYAVAAFMSHFPRLASDVYDVNLFQAGLGIVAQLMGVMALVPILILIQKDPAQLPTTLSNMTGAGYGIWETDIGLSPLLIIFIFKGLASAIAYFRRKGRFTFSHSSLMAILLLVLSIWITIEMALARGIIYTATKQLPILRSLHINVRFTAAFIIPLIILGTIQLHHFFTRNPKQLLFVGSVLLTIASLLSYFTLLKPIHWRECDVSVFDVVYENIRTGNISPVTYITDINSWIGFVEDASSIYPYEPAVGYHLEDFAAQIQLGNVFRIDNGYYNMTNPESLVFPEMNNLQLFERFKVSERDKLEAFLERRQSGWSIPSTLKILNVLSLITVIFTVGVLLMPPFFQIVYALKQRKSSS
jgi:hypothetical protein